METMEILKAILAIILFLPTMLILALAYGALVVLVAIMDVFGVLFEEDGNG